MDVEVVPELVTRTHWYPEHTKCVEVRSYPEWGPLTLFLDRRELKYTYKTASGETKEEDVFELDAEGKPWTIALDREIPKTQRSCLEVRCAALAVECI